MIGTVYGEVGKSVKLSGYADDFDNRIIAVQFSLNDGKTWTDYSTEGADTQRLLRWDFEFTPEEAGAYTLLVRSKNEHGKTSPEAAKVHISVE